MASKYTKKNVNTYNWLRAIPHYLTIYLILYPFYKLWFRIKVYGRENIPKGETLLIASNHLSYFDPTIISLSMRKPVAYMSKVELFEVPVLKQFILMYGAFAVNRDKLDKSTIKTAREILQKGWYVGMFPEGTRSKDGILRNIHKGMPYLSRSTKTRVLPLAIIGSDKKRGPITVKIGKPIDIDRDPDVIGEAWLKAMVELTGFKSLDLEEKQNNQQETEQNQDLTLQEA